MSKLPQELRLVASRRVTDSDWDLDSLINVIDKEIDAIGEGCTNPYITSWSLIDNINLIRGTDIYVGGLTLTFNLHSSVEFLLLLFIFMLKIYTILLVHDKVKALKGLQSQNF